MGTEILQKVDQTIVSIAVRHGKSLGLDTNENARLASSIFEKLVKCKEKKNSAQPAAGAWSLAHMFRRWLKHKLSMWDRGLLVALRNHGHIIPEELSFKDCNSKCTVLCRKQLARTDQSVPTCDLLTMIAFSNAARNRCDMSNDETYTDRKITYFLKN